MRSVQARLRLEPLNGLDAAQIDQVHRLLQDSFAKAGHSTAAAYASASVVEELCANVLEHSNATWLSLDLDLHEGRIFVRIQDNGSAFDVCARIRQLSGGLAERSDGDRQLGLFMVRQLTTGLQCLQDGGINRVQFEVKPQHGRE